MRTVIVDFGMRKQGMVFDKGYNLNLNDVYKDNFKVRLAGQETVSLF